MPASQLVQAPENGASEVTLREYYGAILGSAYVRYLGVLAVGDGAGDARVGRVPTLAEWRGHVQWPVGVGGVERVVRTVCDSSVGETGVSGEGVSAGRDSGRSAGVEAVAEDSCEDNAGTGVGDSGVHNVGGAIIGEQADVVIGRGPNYERNRINREKKKKQQQRYRGTCASVGSVQTVDTRTGVEIEAAQTLAARRVAENKVKIVEAEVAAKLAEHRLKALGDASRTDAVNRLAAARYEQRINQAKASSQESFKKCDESLKSLGSSGSAGEFALKMQIKDAKDNEQVLKFVRQQLDYVSRHVSPEVLDAMGRHVKPPVLQEEFDAFGDCPSDYDEDEREAYYGELNRRNDKAAMFEALW